MDDLILDRVQEHFEADGRSEVMLATYQLLGVPNRYLPNCSKVLGLFAVFWTEVLFSEEMIAELMSTESDIEVLLTTRSNEPVSQQRLSEVVERLLDDPNGFFQHIFFVSIKERETSSLEFYELHREWLDKFSRFAAVIYGERLVRSFCETDLEAIIAPRE